jgi:hypothetical protein
MEQLLTSGMALYLNCQEFIYNSEYLHGCVAILVVCHAMLFAFLSYATHMLRLEIHAMQRFSVSFGLALIHYWYI